MKLDLVLAERRSFSEACISNESISNMKFQKSIMSEIVYPNP